MRTYNNVVHDVLMSASRNLEKIASYCLIEVEAILNLLESRGSTIVVVGSGKSRIIAEKIAATMVSTGTHAISLCAYEALHGDLGVVRSTDSLLVLSASGETPEVLEVASAAKKLGAQVVGITRSRSSRLGLLSDAVVEIGVCEEAGPLSILPTTSTTVTLAIGDAIAMALAERRGVTLQCIARVHPAGAIGKVVGIHSALTPTDVRPASSSI